MSCFNNLFELQKKDLKKLIKSMDETIPVSKFNKKELLCLYFKILGLYREPIKKKICGEIGIGICMEIDNK